MLNKNVVETTWATTKSCSIDIWKYWSAWRTRREQCRKVTLAQSLFTVNHNFLVGPRREKFRFHPDSIINKNVLHKYIYILVIFLEGILSILDRVKPVEITFQDKQKNIPMISSLQIVRSKIWRVQQHMDVSSENASALRGSIYDQINYDRTSRTNTIREIISKWKCPYNHFPLDMPLHFVLSRINHKYFIKQNFSASFQAATIIKIHSMQSDGIVDRTALNVSMFPTFLIWSRQSSWLCNQPLSKVYSSCKYKVS